MLIDAIYMIVNFKKTGKYKMTPCQVENNQFPILIWVQSLLFEHDFKDFNFVNYIDNN